MPEKAYPTQMHRTTRVPADQMIMYVKHSLIVHCGCKVRSIPGVKSQTRPDTGVGEPQG